MIHIPKRTILAVAWLLISGSVAVTTAEKRLIYFRSDGGVTGTGSGPIPDQLDSPGTLRWRTPLDSGHSSPIVCENRIFLTTFNAAKEELATCAFRRFRENTLEKDRACFRHRGV